MPRYFNIVKYVLTTTGWTDIIVPGNCSRVRLLNEDDQYPQQLRSDRGDAGSEMSLLPSATLQIDSPVEAFEQGTVICSMKSTVGVGSVVAQFIR